MTTEHEQFLKAAAGRTRPSTPPDGRYHPDALHAALTIVSTVSQAAATFFNAVVALRGARRGYAENTVARVELAAALDQPDDQLDSFLVALDGQIAEGLSMNVLDPTWRWHARNLKADIAARRDREQSPARHGRRDDETTGRDEEREGGANITRHVVLSSDFVSLLDEPHVPAQRSTTVPRLDANGRREVAMIAAVAASCTGAHLAVRRRNTPRELGDLTALLSSSEQDLAVFNGSEGECRSAILRAELHAGATPPLVLFARDLLTVPKVSDGDEWDQPAEPKAVDQATALAQSINVRLAARGTYLWSVPDRFTPSPASLPWLGACVGPFTFDAGWVRSTIAAYLPQAGLDNDSAGVAALARRAGDPRDVEAMAGVARAITAAGEANLDAACTQVAASFATDRYENRYDPAPFDARLLVCSAAAHQLLARAKHAAANGCRVLAHGPPGGGKSAYSVELARRMAGGAPVRIVGPADFLARAWGDTERLVREIWRRATDDGAVLIVDEFEVVGGRRMLGDMSNNQLLIRSLTDAWLLALDEYPDVPLLATTNDRTAIDPAVLRRFAFVEEFGDRLSAQQERLAWAVLLDQEPPPRWNAVGAAVADFVIAKTRCRMLGAITPDALAQSICEARSARLGGGLPVRHAKDSVH